MGLLDNLLGQQQKDPYSDEPDSAGLLGIFNPDQSYQLSKISQILSALAWGKPIDLAGTDMQHAALSEARNKRRRTRQLAKSYSDKLRAAGNNEAADMLDANPDYIDTIMGKQLDYKLDPQKQFYAQIFGDPLGVEGGGNKPVGGISPEMAEKARKITGMDLTDDEVAQFLLAGPEGGAAALSNIRTNRRLQADVDAENAAKAAKLASVKPFIERIRKDKPELAALYEQNPDKALAALEKEAADLANPEYQRFQKLFGPDFDIDNIDDERRALIESTLGITGISNEDIGTIAAGGWEKLGENIFQTKANIRAEATERRLQEAADLELQKGIEAEKSVEPFIQEIEKDDPALAEAYRKNPSKALEAMQKLRDDQANLEFQQFNKIFPRGFDPYNIQAEDRARVAKLTGIPAPSDEVIQTLATGDWKNLTENILRIKDDLRAAETTKAAAAKAEIEQRQQMTSEQRLTARQLKNDYDREAKGYREVIKIGDRAQRILAKKNINAAEQLQTIYDFITALDDNSSVKEGEVGLAQQVASYTDIAGTYVARVKKGEILAEEAVREIGAQVLSLAEQANKGYFVLNDRYKNFAKEYGVPETMIIGKPESEVDMTGYKSRFNKGGGRFTVEPMGQ